MSTGPFIPTPSQYKNAIKQFVQNNQGTQMSAPPSAEELAGATKITLTKMDVRKPGSGSSDAFVTNSDEVYVHVQNGSIAPPNNDRWFDYGKGPLFE
jgi:hypothetical protein